MPAHWRTEGSVSLLAGRVVRGTAATPRPVCPDPGPESVDFVEELPRNPSGKGPNKELRKLYWREGEREIW